jgi:hypothetical protein
VSLPEEIREISGRLSKSPVTVRRPTEITYQGGTMRYLLMIAETEGGSELTAGTTPESVLAEYGEFFAKYGASGIIQGSERLQPVNDATTVRVRNGEVLTTDGPFAETKEQLAGYVLIDCKDLDEAIEVAAHLPGSRYGCVEVRPIWEM